MAERAFPVPVEAKGSTILPGATFADCFAIRVSGRLTAEEAARLTLERMPRWVSTLMNLRDRLVAMMGLKTLDDQSTAHAHVIGGFPVVSSSVDQVVLGFDDKHLDFRIVIDALPHENGTELRATTLVKPHNLGGRAYLAAVMPFHKRIVPTMLNRLEARALT